MKEVKGMVDNITDWQDEFAKEPKHPSRLNCFSRQCFHTTYTRCSERAKTLEKEAAEMDVQIMRIN